MQSTPESLDRLKLTLKVHEDLMDKSGIAKSCYDIGNMLLNSDKLDESLIYLRRSLKIRMSLNDVAG